MALNMLSFIHPLNPNINDLSILAFLFYSFLKNILFFCILATTSYLLDKIYNFNVTPLTQRLELLGFDSLEGSARYRDQTSRSCGGLVAFCW